MIDRSKLPNSFEFIVTAGAPQIPQPLYDQLAEGGRLVIPIGTGKPQVLTIVTKRLDGALIVDSCECSFVPLVGAAGWPEDSGGGF